MMTRLKRPSASNLLTGSLLPGSSSRARSAQNVDDTAPVEEEGETDPFSKELVRCNSPLGIGTGAQSFAVLLASSKMGDEDETFESTDAGASETYPMEAGQIRKSGHIMIKGNPCKVIDVSTSKTGKHGHAKCHFVAQDIFTGKKMEDLVPASHTTNVPFVKKIELQCIGVDDDGFVSLLTDEGEPREDIKLPNTLPQAPPDAEEVSKRIKEMLDKEVGASPR